MIADALDIEAQAKRRLADEYDAAQERGEVARLGDNSPKTSNKNSKPTSTDLGLTTSAIHEAREFRDAEQVEPGIVRRTLDEAIEAGDEPTLQPMQTRLVSDEDIIDWLNEHLGIYAREVLALRQTITEKDRQIDMYRKLIADFDRQKGTAQ